MTPTPGSQVPFPTSSDLSSETDRPYVGTNGGGMPSASETGSGSTGTATGAGSQVLSRVVQGAHHTIDQLAERAAPAVDRLSQTGDQLGVRAEHLREVGDEWAESVRCTVRENPLAAVAVAAAVGMLIARLTR